MERSTKKRLWWILFILMVTIVALRMAPKPLSLHNENHDLASLEGYHGQIADIEILLYRGANLIDSIIVEKTGISSSKI